MKYEIKKIDWLTSGVFYGIFTGLISLVPMFFGLITLIKIIFSGNYDFKFLFLIFFPLGFFAAGFIMGLIFAVVYNFIAKHWRGIKLDIDYNE